MASGCTICAHRQRKAIDRAILAGASLREVAGQFGVSKNAVDRHKAAHVGPVAGPVAAARAAEVAAAETEVRAAMVDTGRGTLEQVRALGAVARRCLARVTGKLDGDDPEYPDADFDARGAASLIGQVRGALELQAKLLGELQSGTQVAVIVQAERAEFVRVVIGALADEPAALAKVAAAVERAATGGAS